MGECDTQPPTLVACALLLMHAAEPMGGNLRQWHRGTCSLTGSCVCNLEINDCSHSRRLVMNERDAKRAGACRSCGTHAITRLLQRNKHAGAAVKQRHRGHEHCHATQLYQAIQQRSSCNVCHTDDLAGCWTAAAVVCTALCRVLLCLNQLQFKACIYGQ
jgi:hypothetical protein